MNKPFIVLQSKEKETEKGVFITKMQRITTVVDAIFGDKEKKETLYIKGSKQIEVGTEVPAQHIADNYRVEEHPSEMPNQDGSVTKMNLKWLHLK